MNERSRELARHASVDDLVRDERRGLARRQAQTQLEREFREEHTFEPNLEDPIARRAAKKSEWNTASWRRPGRASRVIARGGGAQFSENAAYKELEECTFQPETARPE